MTVLNRLPTSIVTVGWANSLIVCPRGAYCLLSRFKWIALNLDVLASKAKKHTEKLNAYLLNKARGSNEITYLASPVTGGGVAVNRFQQLFLLAIGQGKKQPAEWALFAWQILSLQDQKIVKENKTLETNEENLAELTTQALSFSEKQLPILRSLKMLNEKN